MNDFLQEKSNLQKHEGNSEEDFKGGREKQRTSSPSSGSGFTGEGVVVPHFMGFPGPTLVYIHWAENILPGSSQVDVGGWEEHQNRGQPPACNICIGKAAVRWSLD